jgi:hypothetical protein
VLVFLSYGFDTLLFVFVFPAPWTPLRAMYALMVSIASRMLILVDRPSPCVLFLTAAIAL